MIFLNIRTITLLAVCIFIFSQFAKGQSPRSLNNSGVDSYKKQQFVDAEVNFKKGLEKSNDSFELNYNLGDSYYKQQRYDEAIKSFQNSLSHTEDGNLQSKAFHNIGNSLLKSQKIKESVEAYKNSLKLNPNDKEIKYNLSYALSLLKQQQDQQQNKNQNDKNQDRKDQNKNDQKEGAAGVQVGTAFAYCEESGIRDDYKQAVLRLVAEGRSPVRTDPIASPSGFPFKVVELEGTVADEAVYTARPRVCDLGYLREAYRTPDGRIDFRCPSEPLSVYVSKGGRQEDAAGRKCICNALIATAGAPQVRAQGRFVEAGIITAGDDLAGIGRFMRHGSMRYTAADVIRVLLDERDKP